LADLDSDSLSVGGTAVERADDPLIVWVRAVDPLAAM
jgi:hypothetical protein